MRLLVAIACVSCATSRVDQVRAETPMATPGATEMVELLGLQPGAERAAILHSAFAGSLQIDQAIADIQEEQAALQESIAHVQEAQNTRAGLLNLAAALFAAGSAVGTGLTLEESTTTAGIWITTGASAIGAGVSIVAALAGSSGHAAVPTRTSMLAPLLDKAPGVPAYPPLVWRWLQGDPRRALVDQWSHLGRLGGPDKIDWLSRPVPAGASADLGDLQDRNRMLADVRARVALLKRGLSDLTGSP